MDKLKTIATGGFPFTLDDIRQFLGRLSGSQGIYQAFNNILGGFGDNFIVQGAVASGSSPNVAITEGWVLLDGELIKVDAQTGINTATDNKFVKVTTFDSRGNKTFQNGSIEDTYERNRAVVQGTSGNLDFDGDALGIWQEDDFNVSDYTATTGTWIPNSAQIRTYILGKMMIVTIRITVSTIASGPTQSVFIKIPRGKTVSKVVTNVTKITTSAGPIAAILQTSGVGSILIQPLDETDIPNGGFEVSGQITLEIN